MTDPDTSRTEDDTENQKTILAEVPAPILHCEAGREVFEQGTPASHAFFVESGELEVIVHENGHEVKLAEIGPGEIFGEMGVLEKEARMATVRAVTKSTVKAINRSDIDKRLDQIDDPIVNAVIKGLLKRLRATSADKVKYFTNLAEFQSRMVGMMEKAEQGIDIKRRQEFADEITPLLDQVEAVLDKYRKP